MLTGGAAIRTPALFSRRTTEHGGSTVRINQNIGALNAYRNLTSTGVEFNKSLEKLSSGFRINRAADDAAGLVQSEGLRSQVSGLRVAVRNAQDGISVVQTAEGALTEVHAILQRMRDLAVQASNTGSADSTARNAAQAEVVQLTAEITRITSSTKFGVQALFDGNFGVQAASVASTATAPATAASVLPAASTFTVSVGTLAAVTVSVTAGTYATTTALQTAINNALTAATFAGGSSVSTYVSATVTVDSGGNFITKLTASGINAPAGASLTLGAGTGFLTARGLSAGTTAAAGSGGVFQVGASSGDTINIAISSMSLTSLGINAVDVSNAGAAAINSIDSAISSVSAVRGDLGAKQNRFEHTISNISVTMENLAASESRIRDTDMAKEMTLFTRHQIMTQAGTAMLAQANSAQQSVLALLRG
jgi:flagellin